MIRSRTAAFVALVIGLNFAPSMSRADDPKPLTRIAFGSCVDQDKPVPIFDTMAAAKPELLLLMGDNMYADLDKKLKVTPDVIREKYKQVAQLPGFVKLKATCPMLGTWDDHDYGKNDAGAEWEHKDGAQEAFLDFFGSAERRSAPQAEGRLQRRDLRPGREARAGHHARHALLPQPAQEGPVRPEDAHLGLHSQHRSGATFLGDEQWKWLEAELKKPAEVRLLVSSMQVVADEHPFEKWANIPKERDRLYALINSTGANGVIILSGDRHLAEVSLDTKSIGYPLYDVTSSGFNQASKNWRSPEKNEHRVASMPYGDNFGFITIDWSGDDPRLTVQIRDEDGDATCGFKVRLSTLKGRGPVVAEKLPEGVLSPVQAVKKIGEKVTVQFTVQSVGGKANLYLNSEKDFRAKDNFAVVLPMKAQTGAWAKAGPATFTGKTIRATGTMKLNKDNPQLEIAEAKDLEVVEK